MSENARASMLKVAVALAAVYLVWGSTYLAIRFAIETLPPFLMASVRFLFAGSLLYGWARWKGAPRPSRVHWRSAALIGLFLLLGGNGGVVWAEQRVDSGLAALLVSTEPLWIVLLVWLRPGGSRPTLRVVSGLILGFVGLMLLVKPSPTGGIDPLGAAVIVLAALSWAWGSLYGQRARLPESPLLTTGMQMLCGGGLLLLASLLAGEPAGFDPAAVSLRSALALAYLVVFGALVAFTAYIWLLRARLTGAGLHLRLREPGRGGLPGLGPGRRAADRRHPDRRGGDPLWRRPDHQLAVEIPEGGGSGREGARACVLGGASRGDGGGGVRLAVRRSPTPRVSTPG